MKRKTAVAGAGRRVVLACPFGALKRGDEGAGLVIQNGAAGFTVGEVAPQPGNVGKQTVVSFDAFDASVAVNVPSHWLKPEVKPEPASSESATS